MMITGGARRRFCILKWPLKLKSFYGNFAGTNFPHRVGSRAFFVVKLINVSFVNFMLIMLNIYSFECSFALSCLLAAAGWICFQTLQ